MFEPLPTPREMALWDRAAIEGIGIRGEILMENAGREALAALRECYGPSTGHCVLILAGPGNNGGDAFVIARYLHDHGANVRVLHAKARQAYKGHAAYHLRLAQRTGVLLQHLTRNALARQPQPDVIVDGLLGTGFTGDLKPDYLFFVNETNRLAQNAFVLALDIPSGLNGRSGKPQPEAIRADATVSFGAIKLGLVLPHAAPYVGEVICRDIGIPRQCIESTPPKHFGIAAEIMERIPAPPPELHKGRAGHLLILGGSPGLTGAPHLAALGALRAGCGLVTVACPGALAREIKADRPEIMTLPLGKGSCWDWECLNALAPRLGSFHALAVGPGLGRNLEALDFLKGLCRNLSLPCVFDADALFHLATACPVSEESGPSILPPGSVLTPHPGEMARLLGTTSLKVQQERIPAALLLSKRHQAVTVLKGACTVVADPVGRTHLSPFAEPNLAVAGSGDVLTGVVGSLLARGLSPLHAACLAVYWHGLAGRVLAEEFPGRGNLAGEIATALPRALARAYKENLC
ncbi:MAG: NAD(P)H-hydrate dehydratase [Desulfovibrionaceae bacterium]